MTVFRPNTVADPSSHFTVGKVGCILLDRLEEKKASCSRKKKMPRVLWVGRRRRRHHRQQILWSFFPSLLKRQMGGNSISFLFFLAPFFWSQPVVAPARVPCELVCTKWEIRPRFLAVIAYIYSRLLHLGGPWKTLPAFSWSTVMRRRTCMETVASLGQQQTESTSNSSSVCHCRPSYFLLHLLFSLVRPHPQLVVTLKLHSSHTIFDRKNRAWKQTNKTRKEEKNLVCNKSGEQGTHTHTQKGNMTWCLSYIFGWLPCYSITFCIA